MWVRCVNGCICSEFEFRVEGHESRSVCAVAKTFLLGFSSQKLCRFLWFYDWGVFGRFNDSGGAGCACILSGHENWVTVAGDCMRNVRKCALEQIEIRFEFCGSLSSHADHSIKATYFTIQIGCLQPDANDLSFFNGSARFRHPWTII